MGLLDDLDLGRDQYGDQNRPLKLEGLNTPLPKPEPTPWDDLWVKPKTSKTKEEKRREEKRR